MEVECLALKDLTSPRKSLSVGAEEEEEDEGQTEQKENLCLDWRTPPLKSTESSVAPMLINRKGSTPVVDQVTPIKHSVLAEPWSPTANLKMLISAASPDIRDREMKKVLFRPIENDKDIEVAAEATKAGAVHDDDGGEADTGNAGGNRKDKSLRIMSQKFVMLFLVSRTLTVTLDAAAKILIDESQDSSSHSKYKTKVRRLYDIANVLTSLGLIKKVHVREEKGRKPAFRWLGPVEFNNQGNPAIAAQPMTDRTTGQKVKMTRHSSFNITPTSAAVLRQVYSAPSSPRRDTPAVTTDPAELHRRTTTNSAVCRLQFGASPDSSGRQRPLTSAPSPHCLAYLTSLSQPSVVMLYGSFDQPPEGQRSPRLEGEEVRKRKREETLEEEQGALGKKRAEHEKIISTPSGDTEDCSCTDATKISTNHSEGRPPGLQPTSSDHSRDLLQPSPYLYLPNNTGLNSLNFFLPSNHPPTSAVPTMALSYVLVPSAALSHYPLVTGGHRQQGPEAHAKLGFSLPTTASSGHCGAAPFTLVSSDYGWSPRPSQSSPDVGGQCGPPTGPQQVNNSRVETQTPQTPKDTTASMSRSFFQTPGTLEGGVNTATPAGRKRGSAQRRLDVGHPPVD
ncbi:transcription factor E2F7 [Cynoglossus semilaevis]|uniref:transcription factor E2F7 n=1 Tax=Cynoglossus semilaevis TaxID=244447 RepID=UPI0007DC9485|nr:transcription factor E2F7 [Cynoglossus semilaevis]